MPSVVIDNLKSTVIQREDKGEVLLNVLLSATDFMHACGGKGRCTTCRVRVLDGMEQLSEHTPQEIQFANLNKLQGDERLTCQAKLMGDVVLEVPKQTQLPHLNYQ